MKKPNGSSSEFGSTRRRIGFLILLPLLAASILPTEAASLVAFHRDKDGTEFLYDPKSVIFHGEGLGTVQHKISFQNCTIKETTLTSQVHCGTGRIRTVTVRQTYSNPGDDARYGGETVKKDTSWRKAEPGSPEDALLRRICPGEP